MTAPTLGADEGFTPFEASVAAVLDALRSGEVVTYGEVAAEAGHPGAHRAVGRFLGVHDGYPWWRVVTSTGRLVPGHEVEQADRLAAEGVATGDGRVRPGCHSIRPAHPGHRRDGRMGAPTRVRSAACMPTPGRIRHPG